MSSPPSEPLPLDEYRSYLLLLARMQLDPAVQARVDASDVVQQTLMEAHAKQAQFSGDADALAAWLRTGLANNIRDALRAARRGRRDVRREVAIQEAVDQSSVRLAGLFAGRDPSPSQQAVHAEELLRMAAALDEIPEAQREAIVRHHLQGCSLAETARALDRTEAAVAGLLHRGLRKLRTLMEGGE